MRKKSENPIAKNKLMDAAQALILSKGFMATSVDDVCKAAKLTKGSFFHYFKSKDELGAELLTRYCCSTKEAFKNGCCDKEADPLKRVYGFLDFMMEMARGTSRACLLGTMAQELSDTHPKIRAICAVGFKEAGEVLRKDLVEAKKKYAPKASFDPESLADHFMAVFQGSLILSKTRRDSKVKEENLKHFRTYLTQLFGR